MFLSLMKSQWSGFSTENQEKKNEMEICAYTVINVPWKTVLDNDQAGYKRVLINFMHNLFSLRSEINLSFWKFHIESVVRLHETKDPS